jgi:hypothetical protein
MGNDGSEVRRKAGWRHWMLLLPIAVLSCSNGEERAAWIGSGNGPKSDVPLVAPCQDGQVRSCGVTLGERNGVLACYHGEQVCASGRWSECGGGSVSTQAAPGTSPVPGARPLALGMPSACADNPCDPGCTVFDEQPPTPVQSVAPTPTYNWKTGSLAGLPNGLANKGLKEPCDTGGDCQFNTYCKAPTAGSCDHAPCQPGVALKNGCSSCVSAICAEDPTCCQSASSTNTCSHDPCARGGPLKLGCHSCVDQICAKMPSCCDKNGAWTSACVAEVAATCGRTCECRPGEVEYGNRCYTPVATTQTFSKARSSCTGYGAGDWDLVAINDAAENAFVYNTWGLANRWLGFTDQSGFSVNKKWLWTSGDPAGAWNESGGGAIYTNWSANEPGSSDDCARLRNDGGRWSGEACSSKYATVCEGPKQRMSTGSSTPRAWTAACVAKVDSVCGSRCDAEDPSNASGVCTPWFPGETAPSCSGVDLAVGVPCDGVIPVCNHGRTAAPSGIRIVHFPANSQQYPKCAPDQSHPQMKECFTSAPIPPGQCISVTGCPGLTGNREIMVNPQSGSAVSECACRDNWSLYSGGQCGAPVCQGGGSEAVAVKKPVDIVFIIDNSGSMAGEISAVQDRINSDFSGIIGASGIDYRVIMFSRYGDVNVAVGGSDHPICVKQPLGGNACLDPKNEPLTLNPPRFFHYSADVGSLDSWCLLLGSFNRADEQASPARTWVTQAPAGWSQWLRPNAFKVFVEITDDDVSCTSYGYNFKDNNTVAGGQAAAAAFDAALLALSPEQFGAASARNYVWHSIVAMKANTPSTSAWLPSAPVTASICTPGSEGPGTGYQALSVLTGGLRYPTCLNSNFDAIFNAIAVDVVEKSSAACDYALPTDQSSYDPNQTNVVYNSSKGGVDASTKLTRVSGAASCTANAWYYDDPLAPNKITLCPTACGTVQADATARVWVEFGCPGSAAPVTKTETYFASCDPTSQGPVWLDLGYTASIPAGATIAFRGRVASTQAGLAGASWVALGTADSSKPICPLASSCAIDVFAVLGAQRSTLPWMELEITLNPSSSGGTALLSEWNLAYSCRDNQ